jgi:hypothetical protein
MALTKVSRGLLSTSIVDNGNATAITIDANENVGIGTSNPSTKLEISDGAITAGNSGTVLVGRYSSSFPNPGAGYFSLETNNTDGTNGGITIKTLASGTLTERMRIDSTSIKPTVPIEIGSSSYFLGNATHGYRFNNAANTSNLMILQDSGNLLVGSSSSPQISAGSVARIQVIAESSGATAFSPSLPASATGTSIRSQSVTAAGTGWNHFVGSSGNGSSLTANNIFIYGNGDIGNTNNTYGAISDAKLKENITDATPKLADINAVRVVNYNLIDHPEVKQLGVIAQELEQIFPSMVSETPDRDMEGNDLGTVTKSVKYSVFVPMLIKAIQEQQAIITALETRITQLENN